MGDVRSGEKREGQGTTMVWTLEDEILWLITGVNALEWTPESRGKLVAERRDREEGGGEEEV